MRDRLWRIRRTPQKFHYLDWCEKIKEKYSSREEYGFAGATLTFLQGEKESEQKKSGEERRLRIPITLSISSSRFNTGSSFKS